MIRKLTPLKERFCREYVIDLNGGKAWIRAGGSKAGAKVRASEALADSRVKEIVAMLQKKVADKIEVSATRVIDELAKIGFANVGDYIGKNSIDLSKLNPSQWAAVQEVQFDGRKISKFKLADKIAALELLGKHLKLFTDKVEWLGDDSFVKLLEAARGRVKS